MSEIAKIESETKRMSNLMANLINNLNSQSRSAIAECQNGDSQISADKVI
jgi:hypothetical protein